MIHEPEKIEDIIERKDDWVIKKSPGVPTYKDIRKNPKLGGAREGAGRPKGALNKRTKGALQAKQRFIERVHKNIDKIFNAQLDLALGEKILMVKVTERDSDGRVKRSYHEAVTDPEIIAQYLDNEYGAVNSNYEQMGDDEFYYMTTRPANNQALQSLLDRAYGKAPEKIDIGGSFFKVNDLNIQIIDPKYEEKIERKEIEGEVVEEAENTENK